MADPVSLGKLAYRLSQDEIGILEWDQLPAALKREAVAIADDIGPEGTEFDATIAALIRGANSKLDRLARRTAISIQMTAHTCRLVRGIHHVFIRASRH